MKEYYYEVGGTLFAKDEDDARKKAKYLIWTGNGIWNIAEEHRKVHAGE